MEHRLPALRLTFIMLIAFAIVDIINHLAPWEVIVFAIYGLFLVSPLADWVERTPR